MKRGSDFHCFFVDDIFVTYSIPEHWYDDPLTVNSVLQELMRTPDHLNIFLKSDAGREQPIPCRVTDVDKAERVFRFCPVDPSDLPRIVKENALVFSGASRGAKIEFIAEGSLRVVEEREPLTGNWIYETAFPTQLYRLQRRAFFRVRVSPPTTRVAKVRCKGKEFDFRIQDLSLAGVGLRIKSTTADLPVPGELLPNTWLDFNELGSMRASLKVVTTRKVIERHISDGETELLHMGCEFMDADPKREAFLQKLVFQLELVARNA